MIVLERNGVSMWEDGRFILISLAILTIGIMLWASWLRSQLARQITRNKEHSQLDLQLEHFYSELVEHASDVILRLDRTGIILAINKAGTTILGYPKEELLGQNIAKFMPTDSVEPISFEGSKEYALGDIYLLNQKQELVQLEMSLRRERVDGKTRSAEIIARNVTERRLLDAQL